VANNVTIGGITVDADDPCALYQVLYNARLQMLAGQSIGEVQAGDFNTQRRVKYNTASLSALEAELSKLADLCGQSTGERRGRFAIRAGFRRMPS
jgi:hypothetical protein